MTQPTSTDSDANRIRTKLKPYAVGVGAVLALLLTAVIPPALVEHLLVGLVTSEMPGENAIENTLHAVDFDLVKSVWTIGVLAAFVRHFELVDALRKQEELLRTVAGGAGLLIAFIVSFQLLDVATDALTGSLWQDSVWEAVLLVIGFDESMARLIAFGVALHTALSRGHSVAAHRDTFLLTYLTVAVLSALDNISHIVESVTSGDGFGSVGVILDIFLTDLLTSALWGAVLAGTFGIVFAYGIERYGVVDVGDGRSAVADGGEK